MIIDEVNIEKDPEIVIEFDVWLDDYIHTMLQFEGFNFAKKLNSIKNNKYYLTVQYNIVSQEDLDRYLRNHAQTMREDGLNRFGDKFRAHRRIMKTLKTYS